MSRPVHVYVHVTGHLPAEAVGVSPYCSYVHGSHISIDFPAGLSRNLPVSEIPVPSDPPLYHNFHAHRKSYLFCHSTAQLPFSVHILSADHFLARDITHRPKSAVCLLLLCQMLPTSVHSNMPNREYPTQSAASYKKAPPFSLRYVYRNQNGGRCQVNSSLSARRRAPGRQSADRPWDVRPPAPNR